MSSNHEEEEEVTNALPALQQPRSISQLARIEVEEPPRKMRLMFGEGQVVFLRSDGLRSRIVRTNMKNNRKEKAASKQEVQNQTDSITLNEVIEDVASGRIPHEYIDSTTDPSLSRELPSAEIASGSERSETDRKHPLVTSLTELSAVEREPSRISRKHSGNRGYHPPSEFHGTSTMSTHKRRWTYQTSCLINADEQKDDNQIGCAPDPFLPMPRGRQNEVSTAARMNYAAQRVENRKYRGQAMVYQAVKNTPDRDSITCEKCKMKYFSESKNIQERVSYLPSAHEELLPTVLFNCPVCKEITNAAF